MAQINIQSGLSTIAQAEFTILLKAIDENINYIGNYQFPKINDDFGDIRKEDLLMPLFALKECYKKTLQYF